MEIKITHDALDHTLTYHAAEQNNGSDVLSFTLPRYRGSLDLGALSPSLFLMREDGSTDVIRVAEDHILVMETGTDTVTILWTLTEWATGQPGVLYYQLVFRSNEEQPKRYATFPAKLTVTRSIDAEETLVASYPTFFWQWDQEMKKIKGQIAVLEELPKHPLPLSAPQPVPSDLANTSFPDTVKELGNYSGYASGWRMGNTTCNGDYLLIVAEGMMQEKPILLQFLYFYQSGRLFARFLNQSREPQSWSSFREISYTADNHVQLSRCKAERGFLFNIYNNDQVLPGGRCSTETDVQTFDDPVVGDNGDVSFQTNEEDVKISIANPADRAPHITNGVFVEWTSSNQSAFFPMIRIRLGRPKPEDGALGFDVYCYRDRSPLEVTVTLYACTNSLGTQVVEYGSAKVALPNNGALEHLRIPFSKFGIKDPQKMTDGTAICCRISWNNANQVNYQSDEIWFGNVGYFDEVVY